MKAIKGIELTNSEANSMLLKFSQIEYADQVVKKAVKYLEKALMNEALNDFKALRLKLRFRLDKTGILPVQKKALCYMA
ncbi:hypothetical protein QW180_30970 [Vibrio sinaloensis]|nr:hypothetical protein [Vibrio sinaloensis]